jgi:mono/diheme cytochrome c family protein
MCHGDAGMGNGAAGVACNPRPTDFTDKSIMSRKTDDDLFKVVTKGSPYTGMAPYEKMLSEQDRRNVVAYIRTFATKSNK